LYLIIAKNWGWFLLILIYEKDCRRFLIQIFKNTTKQVLWKHFISWGRNFVVWRRRTYSWVLDFVDCPTHEINKIQNNYLQFLTDAKLRPNTETGSIAKLHVWISEWFGLLSYVTPEDIDPRQPVNVFTAESLQTTYMTPNCQLACHLRDYIHKDVRGAGSFKGLI